MSYTEEQRKENYKRLKEVGFTSKEATRMKDFGPGRLERVIEEKKKQNKDMQRLMPQGGKQ